MDTDAPPGICLLSVSSRVHLWLILFVRYPRISATQTYQMRSRGVKTSHGSNTDQTQIDGPLLRFRVQSVFNPWLTRLCRALHFPVCNLPVILGSGRRPAQVIRSSSFFVRSNILRADR